jgi:hypothetical protein
MGTRVDVAAIVRTMISSKLERRAVLMLPILAMIPPGRAERLPVIRNFVCYYGSGNVETLGRYQLAIVETGNYSGEEIGRMRSKGTVVAGYLSLGEVREEPRSSSATAVPGGPALGSYYLDADGDGKPDRNPAWGALYVDTRSPVWRERILEEFIPALRAKKVNALFLDTLDTVDRYPFTKTGMVELIRSIRMRCPDLPLIANRGFSIMDEAAPSLDAILFEAFSTRWDPATARSVLHSRADLEWVDATLGRIRELGRRSGVQVLVLDYAAPGDLEVLNAAAERARKAGLTYSITLGHLNALPLQGGPGKPR